MAKIKAFWSLDGVASLTMKACGYCGKENDDAALRCWGCGTDFTEESSGKGFTPVVISPIAALLISSLGILLIVLALFVAIGRALLELEIIPGKLPPESMYVVFTSPIPAPYIVLAAGFPVFYFYRIRFPKFYPNGSLVVVVLLAALSILPRLIPHADIAGLWCVPATYLGSGHSSPFGCFLGAALQCAVGVGLIFWFRPRNIVDENDDV